MYIYTLSDPRTKEIRYIGKTNNLSIRYKAHLYKSNKASTHKECWIKGLRQNGLKPILEVLDECNSKDVNFWEKHYICLFKSWGINLTNMTKGGDGVEHTKEVIAKMSASRKGKMIGIHNHKSEPIAQLNKEDGCIISVFPSKMFASKLIGAPIRMIDSYFQRNRVHGGGYDWRMITKDEYTKLVDLYENGSYKYIPLEQKRPVMAFNSNNEIYFNSIYEAAKKLGIQAANITKCLNGSRNHSGGYNFKYV